MKFTLMYSIFFLLINQHPKFPLVINEILFNPKAGGVDFVELYNPSAAVVDLQYLYLGNVDQNGQISNLYKISNVSHPMSPGTFRVLTTDPEIVAMHYPAAYPQRMIRMSRFPNFNNGQGHVILACFQLRPDGSSRLEIVDSLHYTEKMHSPFLKNPKGISLERHSVTSSANAPGNFKSAAVISGGATPGYQNSSVYDPENRMVLRSKIIAPHDPQGYQQLQIDYNIAKAGLMATVQIFNNGGRLIKNIMRNSSIPSAGSWVWDPYDDRQQRPPQGIYTLVIELYNSSGYRQVFRKSFVLTY